MVGRWMRVVTEWPGAVRRMTALQDARLRRLVRFAVRHNAYYRDLFERQGLKPATVRGIADLKELPLLERSAIRDHGRSMVSDHVRVERCRVEHTNGTTGEPLRVCTSPEEMLFKHALWFTGYMRHGLRPWHRQAKFMIRQAMPKEPYAVQRLGLFPRRYFSVTVPTGAKIDWLRAQRPDALFAWGSVLNEICAKLDEWDQTLPVPLIVSSSDSVLEDQVRARMPGRLLDVYGAMETGPLAWKCAVGDGYHVDPRWTVLEILDEAGQPAEQGRIVCTTLWRRAQPLLRYDIGDLGEWGRGACGCGSSMPWLRSSPRRWS